MGEVLEDVGNGVVLLLDAAVFVVVLEEVDVKEVLVVDVVVDVEGSLVVVLEEVDEEVLVDVEGSVVVVLEEEVLMLVVVVDVEVFKAVVLEDVDEDEVLVLVVVVATVRYAGNRVSVRKGRENKTKSGRNCHKANIG